MPGGRKNRRIRKNPWLRGAIAHRGLLPGEGGAPLENTLSAFLRCAEAGVPMELDVRLSRDNVPVVHHDADLGRLWGKEAPLCALTAQQLGALRAPGGEEGVPALSQVLRAVGGRAPVLIEVKQTALGGVGPLERAVAALLREYSGPYALESFHPRSVRILRRLLPDAPLGLLAARRIQGAHPVLSFILGRLLLFPWVRPDFIAYEKGGLCASAVQRRRKRGVPVIAFTVRSREEARDALVRCDGYIFEGFFPEGTGKTEGETGGPDDGRTGEQDGE